MDAARLSQWKAGDEGVITEVGAGGAVADRLLELGLLPGAWLRVVQHGSPMLIQVGDSRLCIRREDAGRISGQIIAAHTSAALAHAAEASATSA